MVLINQIQASYILILIIIQTVLTVGLTNNEPINVGITFTKVATNENLQNKFKLCVTSLLKHAKVDINFYIIGDNDSQLIAKRIFAEAEDVQIKYEVKSLNADELAKKMHKLVAKMQSHFSSSPKAYYGDSLFFLSIGLYKVFDPNVKRIILLDADLKFVEDIGQLNGLFNDFTESNLIGIARDAQPVYRHLFWKYRNENPGTRVGNPPPNGLTGFNSGVLLLDLEKMRSSKLYDSLITPEAVERLTNKYYFKGHLGDQDFFTLIGMDYEHLFYVLPCSWNRQICKWWNNHGYKDVFNEYFQCNERVKIWHGNCNTPIPESEEEFNKTNDVKKKTEL